MIEIATLIVIGLLVYLAVIAQEAVRHLRKISAATGYTTVGGSFVRVKQAPPPPLPVDYPSELGPAVAQYSPRSAYGRSG
jgi:hypothetical protein